MRFNESLFVTVKLLELSVPLLVFFSKISHIQLRITLAIDLMQNCDIQNYCREIQYFQTIQRRE